MPIFISEEEKTAIQDYFNHPGRYTSDEVVATLSGGLPDGAKVSRAKSSYEKADIPKRYIILAGTDGLSRYIPIVTGLLDDPGTHSATRVNGTIYFHQNQDDLPKKLPENFEDYCEIDADDSENESTIAYRAAWERALGKPAYVHNLVDISLFKKTVKYATDSDGHIFYLKSYASFVVGGLSLPNPVERYAPQLYMGPSIFRRAVFYGNIQTKRVDVTRDSGENLEEFISSHQDAFSSVTKEVLAREILKQYLVQINEKKIVHTDIKPTNICVKTTDGEGEQFEVVFIDWDEAFSIGTPNLLGSGTPGYMAPEFFKTPQDFERQLENRGAGIEIYFDSLKANYNNLFSESTDIYALGKVILCHLQIEPPSSLYQLVHAMCYNIPSMRPSSEEINEAIEQSANSQFIASGY